MSSTLSIQLEQLRQKGLYQLFVTLEEVFQQLEVDFYLIGALARDTWFARESLRSRATKDIDFAIFIQDGDKYEAVKKILTKNHGFQSLKSNAYCLRAPDHTQIDLWPFGEIENKAGNVEIPGVGLSTVNMAGFREVYYNGLSHVKAQNETGKDLKFKVATLPSIVMLKLLAFDDRPDQRYKDIKDIRDILDQYHKIEDHNIYDNHYDLLVEVIDFTSPAFAARVIGREIQKLTAENPPLLARVSQILQFEPDNIENNSMIRTLFRPEDNSLNFSAHLITALYQGLTDRSYPKNSP